MLDKFIGDAIMAGFGIPVSYPDNEDRALRAALSMITELWEWNTLRTARGQLPLEHGIGLNTGQIVSGNIGSPKRMDYTMIGDAVNLASRLESATKQYHARILISQFTKAKLRGTYRMRDVDLVIVKGKTEPVGVHEVLDYHTDESFPNLMDVVNQFNEGVKEYRKGNFTRALGYFGEALKANARDELSTLYVERCNILLKTPPKDWNGVWILGSK
jgi:adenylate cyclase